MKTTLIAAAATIALATTPAFADVGTLVPTQVVLEIQNPGNGEGECFYVHTATQLNNGQILPFSSWYAVAPPGSTINQLTIPAVGGIGPLARPATTTTQNEFQFGWNLFLQARVFGLPINIVKTGKFVCQSTLNPAGFEEITPNTAL